MDRWGQGDRTESQVTSRVPLGLRFPGGIYLFSSQSPPRPARQLSCHPSPEKPGDPEPLPCGPPLCGRRAQQRGQDTGKMLRVIDSPLTGTTSLLTSAHRRQINIALRASHTVALDLGKAEIITGNLPLAPGYNIQGQTEHMWIYICVNIHWPYFVYCFYSEKLLSVLSIKFHLLNANALEFQTHFKYINQALVFCLIL